MKARNRRDFLKTSVAAGVAIAAPTIVSSSALGLGRAVAPSERIVLGGLGIGPRGTVDLKCFLKNPDVQFVAIADLQKTRREAVKTLVDGTYGNKDCVLYQDMYDILAREDIDSLLIATGDRWHTMASILAAKAGKDVYCEKPCSLTIAESRVAPTLRLLARSPFGDAAVMAGESAVAGLAAAIAAARSPALGEALGLDGKSRVLAIGTEGATDPVIYARFVSQA